MDFMGDAYRDCLWMSIVVVFLLFDKVDTL
jgi:hypothetical protein